MRDSLGELLVVCDMDGTLLRSDHTIAPCDMETIRLFVALGGHFTVATGRTLRSIDMYAELAKTIDPAITYGGCVIYDFKKQTAVQSTILPHLAARQCLRDVLKAFPGLGAMVMGSDLRHYQAAPSLALHGLVQDEMMAYFMRPHEDMPDEWHKVVFAAHEELLAEVQAYIAERTYPGVYFVPSGPLYLEMMPKGASKGSAIHALCDLLGVSIKNTIAIGDYYNDAELMKQAGHAVAVGNAPEDIKQLADEVIAPNDEGGVGQYLYKIIREYEQ